VWCGVGINSYNHTCLPVKEESASVGTALEGMVSGVVSLGKGLFSGAKSVGLGIGGVFAGQDAPQRPPSGRGKR
jgi:hypothetical protein